MFVLSTFPYPHPDRMPGPCSFGTFPLFCATPSPLDVSLLIALSAPEVLPPPKKISTNNCPWANNLKSSRALQRLTPDTRSSFPWLEDGGKTQRHTAAVSLAIRHVAVLCRVPCCPGSWAVRFLCIWSYKRGEVGGSSGCNQRFDSSDDFQAGFGQVRSGQVSTGLAKATEWTAGLFRGWMSYLFFCKLWTCREDKGWAIVPKVCHPFPSFARRTLEEEDGEEKVKDPMASRRLRTSHHQR